MIGKNFKIYFTSILLITIPIIISNIYYSDDLNRALNGYTFWGIDGRPLSDHLMMALNFNHHLSDLAPLPLILSCILIAISFDIFYKKILRNNEEYIFLPIAFLVSPFIIEPLSYRFDSLTISASIFFSFAFISINCKNSIISFILHCAFIICVFSLYQPSINIALILISIEFIASIKFKDDPLHIIKKVFRRLAEIAIGSIIYLKLVLPLTHVGDNAPNHPGISGKILDNALDNSLSYYRFYSENVIPSYGQYLLLSITVVCITLSLFNSIKYKSEISSSYSWMIVVASLFIVPATAVASMASLLILENSIATFARVYIGLNGFALFAFSVFYFSNSWNRVSNCLLIVFYLYMVSFAFSYGNASRMQNETNLQTISVIKNAIKDFPDNSLNVFFTGTSPKSQVLINSSQNHPLFKIIILDYFYNWFGAHTYMRINGINQKYPDYQSSDALEFINGYCSDNEIYSSAHIKIYQNKDNLMVSFSDRNCH